MSAPVLLRVDSSPRSVSVSRRLTDHFVAAWSAANPDGEVRVHDLAELTLPHLGESELASWYVPVDAQSELDRIVLRRSDQLVDDLLAATEVVIGAPMWNFSIPSSLKAWIDHVVRAGRTIDVGPAGLRGLVAAERAIVISSRGSDFRTGSPAAAFDYQEPYLRQFLGMLGFSTVEFVTADHQGPNWADGASVIEASEARLSELADAVSATR